MIHFAVVIPMKDRMHFGTRTSISRRGASKEAERFSIQRHIATLIAYV